MIFTGLLGKGWAQLRPGANRVAASRVVMAAVRRDSGMGWGSSSGCETGTRP